MPLPLGLTDAKLRSLHFEAGQRDYPDRDGLFVRVGTKTKTFMVTVHTHGKRQRVALGRYPDLTLSRAREIARQKRTEALSAPETSQLTFADALEPTTVSTVLSRDPSPARNAGASSTSIFGRTWPRSSSRVSRPRSSPPFSTPLSATHRAGAPTSS